MRHSAEHKRDRLEKLLQITSHDFQLTFAFEEQDRLADDRVIVGISDSDVRWAEYRVLKGKALQLLGHYLSGSAAAAQQPDVDQQAGAPGLVRLWHALEDARVENWMVRRWPGMVKAFEAKLPPHLGGALLRKAPTWHQVTTGIYLVGRGIQGGQFEPRVLEALAETRKWILYGAQGEDPQASLTAVRVIYPRLRRLLNHAPEPHRRVGPHRDAPEEASSAKAEGREKHSESAADGVPEIDIDEGLVWARPLGQARLLPEWYRPGSAPWFETGLGKKKIHPTALRSDRQTIVLPPRGDMLAYRSLRQEVQREAGFLFSRLLRVLQEERYLRYAGRFRSGKLGMNKLWKQRLADYRLFRRREDGDRQATAFSLLVDESASMQGREKYKMAAKAAVLLGETLSRLEVPLEIIGFTTAEFEAREAMRLGLTPAHEYRTMRCSTLEHRLYKSFDEPYRYARTRLSGLQPRHNNWDEEHLFFAFRRIRLRPEPTKVILVICDGQPNGDAEHLARAVGLVERQGCKVVGIGIGEEFVHRLYRNAIVVADFHQMGEALLGILAREMGAGGVHPVRAAQTVAAGEIRPWPRQ